MEGAPLLPRRSLHKKGTKPLSGEHREERKATCSAVQSSMSSMQANGLQFLQSAKNVHDNYPKLDADTVARAAAKLASVLGINIQEQAVDDANDPNDDDDDD